MNKLESCQENKEANRRVYAEAAGRCMTCHCELEYIEIETDFGPDISSTEKECPQCGWKY